MERESPEAFRHAEMATQRQFVLQALVTVGDDCAGLIAARDNS